METSEMLFQFWGKTPRHGDPPSRFHPALYHMLDVAFVAEALLHNGSPRLRCALQHAWDGCDPEGLVDWLPFLIATHDLGKISAAFQGQAKQEATRLQRERLEQAGVRFAPTAGPELYHAAVSALWLHEHLRSQESGIADALIWTLRDAMSGHHGRFAQESMRDLRGRQSRWERLEPRWADWRAEAYRTLRSVLAPSTNLVDLGAPRRLAPATVALTGFIIWCDWMGSNELDFPAEPPSELALEDYVTLSRQRAAHAVQQAGLLHSRPAPSYTGFSSVFPEIPAPRPLQAVIDRFTDDDLRDPLLVVIEAPTGEGKTEAALALARRIAALTGADESFFALPTMATGNQMFTRLTALYDRLYQDDGAVRLTHSQALVVEEELRRAALATDYDQFDADGASAPSAIQWFAGSKKAMLAPFGVGTVDQIELAGLKVRHYMLRLFGLAGKVVIIDEIHAYDAYMSTILEHTLSWLASLGSTVILLSATLPAARHQALARAYLTGLGDQQPLEIPADVPYPAVSCYRQGRSQRQTCAVFRGDQHFTLRIREQRSASDEARYLLDMVRDGGAVARLCNRVDDAQAIYRELRAQLPPDQRVLLHARFPLEQRQRREQHIEDMVGKRTSRNPQDALIIVGTQVLEQSLDYDVDVMISDFAPIDLLLQRAGRLHRHDRAGKRPERHAHPVLEAVLPYTETGAPDWTRWRPIYEPYVLWRSWDVLRTAGTDRDIVLPRDYRPLIEAVYTTLLPPAIDETYAAVLEESWNIYQRNIQDQEAKGRQPLIPPATHPDAITEDRNRTFIDDESGQAASSQLAKTRLGDRITVVPLYSVRGRLSLDPQGTMQLSPDLVPPVESPRNVSQKDLLARAIPISDRRIIAAYRDEQRPRTLHWPWPDTPALLRSLYPLPLDAQHQAIFDGRLVTLDPDLGLIIEKETL